MTILKTQSIMDHVTECVNAYCKLNGLEPASIDELICEYPEHETVLQPLYNMWMIVEHDSSTLDRTVRAGFAWHETYPECSKPSTWTLMLLDEYINDNWRDYVESASQWLGLSDMEKSDEHTIGIYKLVAEVAKSLDCTFDQASIFIYLSQTQYPQSFREWQASRRERTPEQFEAMPEFAQGYDVEEAYGDVEYLYTYNNATYIEKRKDGIYYVETVRDGCVDKDLETVEKYLYNWSLANT